MGAFSPRSQTLFGNTKIIGSAVLLTSFALKLELGSEMYALWKTQNLKNKRLQVLSNQLDEGFGGLHGAAVTIEETVDRIPCG